MKITLRPYTHDKARWHVDVRLMHPCTPEQVIRRRLVAPAGLSEPQARAWGERQVHAILREELGGAAAPVPSSGPDPRQEATARSTPRTTTPKTESTTATASRTRAARTAPVAVAQVVPLARARRSTSPPSMTPPRTAPVEVTLAEFYDQRFDAEHVRLQKPATQESYELNYRRHILPQLGGLPLSAIDEDRLSAFRARLCQRLSIGTANLVLSQLAKLLRFARKVRALAALPEIEMLPTPRARPKDVFSAAEIDALLKAAAAIDESWELILLLALDAGMRASEICALEWRDVDLEGEMLTIQHGVFKGKSQTPKGTIGKVAMSAALCQAIERHRRREPVGPLVLYRKNHKTGMEWRPHTRHSITCLLHRIQETAGLRTSGPHLLRHTALTRLSNLGASVYVIQAVARHSDLQTTQAYLHTQQATQTRAAAELLNQAAAASGRGKSLAKVAKRRRT